MSSDEELKSRLSRHLRVEQKERVKTAGQHFYRGEATNFQPYLHNYTEPGFFETYLFKGWMPDAPQIGKGTKVTAFGSCFAANITSHLTAIGYSTSKERDPDIHISRVGEGLVNVQALAGQFEWALEGKKPTDGMWEGYDASARYDEELRLRTRAMMLDTDFFIVTLGLSEVWYDEVTGGVFWHAVPLRRYDPARHKFRVNSFAETKAQLASIYGMVRRHVPKARVLFTLSPIPLAATFRPIGCLTASAASKAILRAALDEFIRENAAELNVRLFYFPSYELVNECFPSRFKYDGRHPHDIAIEIVMRAFEALYCDTGRSLAEVEALYRDVRALSLKDMAAAQIALEDAALPEAPAPPKPKAPKPPKPPQPKRSLLRRALSAAKRRLPF